MDSFIKTNALSDTFAYLDDVTVCGKTKEHHDANLAKFLEAAKEHNLTLNVTKCKIGVEELDLLGFIISQGEIKPDPVRTEPLRKLELPRDQKSLQRCVGMFAHYSQWIPNYSKKIQPFDQLFISTL